MAGGGFMKFSRRNIFLFFSDLVIAALAMVGAHLLKYDSLGVRFGLEYWSKLIPVIWIVNQVVFVTLGLYRPLWRYANLRDILKIIVGIGLSQALILVVLNIINIRVPSSVLIIYSLLFMIGIAALRLAFRLRIDVYEELVGRKHKGKRALIAGAGQAGAIVVGEMLRDPNHRYYPVALVDDDLAKQAMELNGVPVRGRLKDIPALIGDYRVQEVIIAIPAIPRITVQSLVKTCKGLNIPLRIIPGISEIINGRVSVSQLREIRIEDLLGREPIHMDMNNIAHYLRGKRILVTGAGGSIGSEIVRQISRFDPELIIMMGRGENSIYEIEQEMHDFLPETPACDIRDRDFVDQLFDRLRPQVVFHAAAHKHVPLMESWPKEAVKNNIFGSFNVISACDRYNVERFVLISTDKAVNPTSIMGATKRVAEFIMQIYAKLRKSTVYTAVRFGNVLGSRGSVVPLFTKQIARGGPVTITHPDMTRYFMTIPEAVQLVIQAGSMAQGGEVFVLDMGEPVRIVDLAENMIRLSGYEPGKDIKVEVVGIRPGEKLYEELLTAEEGTNATRHSRIFVAKIPVEMDTELKAIKERLSVCLQHGDVNAILEYVEDSVIGGGDRIGKRTGTAEEQVAASGFLH
jgi:FlaA1/EpsC-like NDP-sugar epimerase